MPNVGETCKLTSWIVSCLRSCKLPVKSKSSSAHRESFDAKNGLQVMSTRSSKILYVWEMAAMTLGLRNYMQVGCVRSSSVQRSVFQLSDVRHLQQKRRHLHVTTTESAPSDLLIPYPSWDYFVFSSISKVFLTGYLVTLPCSRT